MLSRLPIILCVFAFCFALTQTCHATRLLTKEEAFDAVFGKGCEISEEVKELTGDSLVRVLNALGGSLTYEHGHEPTTVDATAGEQKVPVTFYRAVKDGQTVGIALIDSQPGKWGEVQFMIAFNEDGSVSKVVVMSLSEKRGRGLSRASFLKQYEGKTADSELQVRKDINALTGATISSECATFAVKRAVLIYKELYLVAAETKGDGGGEGADVGKGADADNAAEGDNTNEGGDTGE